MAYKFIAVNKQYRRLLSGKKDYHVLVRMASEYAALRHHLGGASGRLARQGLDLVDQIDALEAEVDAFPAESLLQYLRKLSTSLDVPDQDTLHAIQRSMVVIGEDIDIIRLSLDVLKQPTEDALREVLRRGHVIDGKTAQAVAYRALSAHLKDATTTVMTAILSLVAALSGCLTDEVSEQAMIVGYFVGNTKARIADLG